MTTSGGQAKRLSVISFSPIASDARVLRQAEYASSHYSVSVFGYGARPAALPGNVDFVSIPTISDFSILRKARTAGLIAAGRVAPAQAYESLYWRRADVRALVHALRARPTEIIHANDWPMLPMAQRVAQETGATFLLDLHEYAPEQFVNRPYRRHFYRPMVDYFLRRYAGSAGAHVTVGEMIAERYEQEYGFRSAVIRNAPRPNTGAKSGDTDPERINLVHHGALIPDRDLERMIDCMSHAETRFVLHLLLTGPNRRYLQALKKRAAHRAPGRIFFHRPVPPDQLPERLAEYDIGFFLLPPTSFSYAAALPNKFFEFLAAGLAVSIGPSPEMARLIDRYKCGLVSETFEPELVAEDINRLEGDEIDGMKSNARIAHLSLNADIEMANLLEIYARLSANGSLVQNSAGSL